MSSYHQEYLQKREEFERIKVKAMDGVRARQLIKSCAQSG